MGLVRRLDRRAAPVASRPAYSAASGTCGPGAARACGTGSPPCRPERGAAGAPARERGHRPGTGSGAGDLRAGPVGVVAVVAVAAVGDDEVHRLGAGDVGGQRVAAGGAGDDPAVGDLLAVGEDLELHRALAVLLLVVDADRGRQRGAGA